MKRKSAFTLIELLVVIAIIAILAAIISPAFARAREGASRSNDISSMNSLRSAILLYKVDNGAFPPALLGYVNRYQTGPNTGNVIPASAITGFLYPKRVDSINVFRPSTLQRKETDLTNAVWPRGDTRAPGTAPQLDLNGDGAVTAADDTINNRQAYENVPVRVQPSNNTSALLEFYQISGYDVAQVPADTLGTPATPSYSRWQLRYTLFWSNYAIGAGAGNGSGSPFDDPRQLGYVDPPENTVITWNSQYRDSEPSGTARVPTRTKKDIVLFLGGSAKPYSSRDMFDYTWRALP